MIVAVRAHVFLDRVRTTPMATRPAPTTATIGREGNAAMRTKPVTNVPNRAPNVPNAE